MRGRNAGGKGLIARHKTSQCEIMRQCKIYAPLAFKKKSSAIGTNIACSSCAETVAVAKLHGRVDIRI